MTKFEKLQNVLGEIVVDIEHDCNMMRTSAVGGYGLTKVERETLNARASDLFKIYLELLPLIRKDFGEECEN